MKASRQATVSDHALVRYIERIMGIDVEAVRQAICTPEIRRAMMAGAETVSIGNVTYVLQGYMIVTVRPRGRRKRRSA